MTTNDTSGKAKNSTIQQWSLARQQLWPWSRSKVKVTAWCQLKGIVTRIRHAKYQCSIINTSEDMSKVKVFVTDGQTDRQKDEWVFMSPLSRKAGDNNYSWLQINKSFINIFIAISKMNPRISKQIHTIQVEFGYRHIPCCGLGWIEPICLMLE